jgi:hypothetical protein
VAFLKKSIAPPFARSVKRTAVSTRGRRARIVVLEAVLSLLIVIT